MAYADIKDAAEYNEAAREANPENPDDFAPYTVKPEWMTDELWAEYEEAAEQERKMASITKMLNATAGKRNNLYTGGERRVKWM